ncbi:MAG: AAA family ATPase [Polyangiaceae bacterium]
MDKGTNGTVDLSDVRRRLRVLQDALTATYREREGAIECIVLAALAGHHALLVGPPGTAKSALFTSFLASFTDARMLVTLITKFTTEDELFGPVKLSALKRDTWERNLEGRLAGVECAFLDEVFKGSDAILNTLLSAMNERQYKGQPVPLRMIVGASNELPEEDTLAAVYDRFLVRDVVQYIDADATWTDLLTHPPDYRPPTTISLHEWDAARAAVGMVAVPHGVVHELLRIRTELKAQRLVISDRRWLALRSVLQAAAWLDEATEVELDHVEVSRFVLWKSPDDRMKVQAVLETVDRSAVARAVQIVDAALKCYASRPLEPTAYMDALPRITAEITDAAKKIQQELSGGVSKRAHRRIQPKLDELKRVHESLKGDLARRYQI